MKKHNRDELTRIRCNLPGLSDKEKKAIYVRTLREIGLKDMKELTEDFKRIHEKLFALTKGLCREIPSLPFEKDPDPHLWWIALTGTDVQDYWIEECEALGNQLEEECKTRRNTRGKISPKLKVIRGGAVDMTKNIIKR